MLLGLCLSALHMRAAGSNINPSWLITLPADQLLTNTTTQGAKGRIGFLSACSARHSTQHRARHRMQALQCAHNQTDRQTNRQTHTQTCRQKKQKGACAQPQICLLSGGRRPHTLQVSINVCAQSLYGPNTGSELQNPALPLSTHNMLRKCTHHR